jgi:hypothetical protein
LAEQTIRPLDKEEWLRLADEWIRLAREAEARQLRNSEHLRLLGIWGHVDKSTDQT